MSDKWDDKWLYFSRNARKGIFFFLFLFILIAVFPRLYYNFIWEPPKYEIEEIIIEKKAEQQKIVKYTIPSQPFNPNTYKVEDWVKIGISEKQAQTIINYLNSGAQLKVKSDVKKLYPITEELYLLLEPLIDLPNTKEQKQNITMTESKSLSEQNESLDEKSKVKPSKIGESISINKATKEELLQIKGIGSFFASEIIKLREAYGGIIEAKQLLSIYNFTEETLAQVLPYLIINPSEVEKININTASENRLKKHPLISNDMAKSIVYYREKIKEYESLDELLLSPYISTTIYKELKPYLTVR